MFRNQKKGSPNTPSFPQRNTPQQTVRCSRTLFRKNYDSLFVGHSNVDVENPYKSWEDWALDFGFGFFPGSWVGWHKAHQFLAF